MLSCPIAALLVSNCLAAASLVPEGSSETARWITAPTPTPTIRIREALPDVSIPSFSIPPVSIPPVVIPPVSITPVSLPPLSLDLPSPKCTQTSTPGKDGYLPPAECGALWNYFPSFAAAVAFAVLFGAALIIHVGQAVLHRTGFAWVVIMASLWECASFTFRAVGSKDQQNMAFATISQLFVLLSPLWVNAFAYMVFARVVHFFSPSRKVWILSPGILALIFVTLDVISFIVQLIGGGMAGPGSDPASQRRGIDIYMGGIGMQEGFIVVFLGLVIKFHWDQVQAEKTGVLSSNKTAWRPLTYALYGCLFSISVRIIFRLVEFSSGPGQENPLPHTESYFYALDAVPMLLAISCWNAIHPGRYMQGPDSKMPRSWLSRHVCCCCQSKGQRRAGTAPAIRKRWRYKRQGFMLQEYP